MALVLLSLIAASSLQSIGDADVPKQIASPHHEQKVAAMKSHDYDLLMIGDSITHTLGEFDGEWIPLKKTWITHFAPRNAINLGYSGYRTENILWNLQNGELDCAKSPKVAILLIGTNNTDDVNFKTVHTPEQIFAGTKAIVDTIRKQHPTTKILVLKIFPRGGSKAVTDYHRRFIGSDKCLAIGAKAGELTKKLADNKHVFWLNLDSVFRRKDGTLNPDLMPDLLHPGELGAEAWATALEPTLSKLMGDRIIKGERQIALEKAPKAVQFLEGKRILILGDSITQDGRYVSFMEYLLEKQYPHLNFNFFSAGLASETVSGLTEEGHPFPRPNAHERLKRAIKAVRPDIVLACYGMNDGIYKPFAEDRFDRFKAGIRAMGDACEEAGTKLILVTPPSMKAAAFGANLTKRGEKPSYGKPYEFYDREVLAKYALWELEAKPGDAWVVDLHSTMAKLSTPSLHDAGDGIHPNDFGHMVMGRTILRGLGADCGPKDWAEGLRQAKADPLFQLVDKHRRTRSDGWLPYIGYTRGTRVRSIDIVTTEDAAASLQSQVDALRRG